MSSSKSLSFSVDHCYEWLSRSFFLVFYLSFLFWGALNFNVFSLNLAPWDVLFILYFLLLLPFYKKIKIDKYGILIYLQLIIFILYASFPMMIGIQYSSGSFTLYIQLLRCVLIFFVTVVFIKSVNLDFIFYWINRIGFIYSILMLILFFLVIKGYDIPVYERGEFDSIRFEGFAFDANFLGFFLVFPFLFSLSRRRYFSSIVILSVIILTLSRSVLFLLFLSFFMVIILRKENFKRKMIEVFSVLVFTAFFLVLSLFRFPSMDFSIYEFISLRLTQGSPRFEMWVTLLELYSDHPIVGHGLRVSTLLLGNYAHNSYVETFFEYGLIGGVILLSFLISGFILSVNIIQRWAYCIPVAQVYIIMLGSFAFFTILYHPFFWMIFGILVGLHNRMNNSLS